MNYNKSGIYLIINIETGDRYIGSAQSLGRRFSNHKSFLIKNKHTNIILQRSYNKYGYEKFYFIILEECSNKLLEREQYYLDTLLPEFNIAKCASATMKGRNHSESSRIKMLNRPAWNKGIPRTEEERQLMSQRKKEENTKKSKEWHDNLSKIYSESSSRYWLGKNLPKEAIRKIKEHAKTISHKIKCINNGIIYSSQLEAAKALGIKQGHISEVLNGKRSSVKGYLFERIKDVA